MTDGVVSVPGDTNWHSARTLRAGQLGQLGWRDSAVAAAWAVRDHPELLGPALLGFLARGGLVTFLLPVVVLPTPTGVGTFVGGNALTGAGATDALIGLVVVAVTTAAVLLLSGLAVGAVADVLLFRAAVAARLARSRGLVTAAGHEIAEREAAAMVPLDAGMIGRLTALRAVCLVPLALAAAWAAARLVAATYHQLILPGDLAVPLALRALGEAAGAAVVVVIAWLLGELAHGIASRRLLARGGSTFTAFLDAGLAMARRPLTGIGTFVGSTATLVALVVPVLLLSAVLWSLVQAALADDAVVLAVPLTFAFVAVWGGGLFAVGAIAAWRSVFGGLDTLRSLPPTGAESSAAATSPLRLGPNPD